MKKLVLLILFVPRILLASVLFTESWTQDLRNAVLMDLASGSYRSGRNQEAKHYLEKLLEGDSTNQDANYFLGALFLMEENVEAALKYWNRIGEPRVRNVLVEPNLNVNPALLDRAFAFSPAAVATVEDYRETKLRLDSTGVFRNYQLALKPLQQDRSFDLLFQGKTKRGWSASPLKIAAVLAEALVEDRVRPEFYNLDHNTASFVSLWSWDEYRNRMFISFSLPLSRIPHSRLRIFTDNRFETWNFGSDVDLRRWEFGVELSRPVDSHWSWKAGTAVSHRQFQANNLIDFTSPRWRLEVFAGADVVLVSIPERRFTMKSHTYSDIATHDSKFSVMQSISWQWFPQPSGDDLTWSGELGAARMFGQPSLDEFYRLGADRSDTLMLRAHRSEMDQLGENPITDAYLLINTELTKTVYKNPIFRCQITPFVDLAHTAKHPLQDRQNWFIDTGIKTGLQVMKSVEINVTYGKDLRTGRNVLYFGASL